MGRRTKDRNITVSRDHRGKAVKQRKKIHTGERGGEFYMYRGRRVYVDGDRKRGVS